MLLLFMFPWQIVNDVQIKVQRNTCYLTNCVIFILYETVVQCLLDCESSVDTVYKSNIKEMFKANMLQAGSCFRAPWIYDPLKTNREKEKRGQSATNTKQFFICFICIKIFRQPMMSYRLLQMMQFLVHLSNYQPRGNDIHVLYVAEVTVQKGFWTST